ncbi:hypothetical protein SDC9_137238 [bioreactor metagenome]|uniref:Uncharacterized protein n=1 Tax=bioreactor metagenome TaxID=1076179 RepID=A0A645DLK6_9ZZZZ
MYHNLIVCKSLRIWACSVRKPASHGKHEIRLCQRHVRICISVYPCHSKQKRRNSAVRGLSHHCVRHGNCVYVRKTLHCVRSSRGHNSAAAKNYRTETSVHKADDTVFHIRERVFICSFVRKYRMRLSARFRTENIFRNVYQHRSGTSGGCYRICLVQNRRKHIRAFQ